jgi:hypothetical protein
LIWKSEAASRQLQKHKKKGSCGRYHYHSAGSNFIPDAMILCALWRVLLILIDV